MTLDSILGWVMPAGVLFLIGALIYGKNKEAIDKAALTIKGWFKGKKQQIEEEQAQHGQSILTYK